LLAAIGEAQTFQARRHRRPAVGDFEDAGDEVEILFQRQILVEAELLGHVAHASPDVAPLGCEVESEARASPGIGGEQAAENLKEGRLAAAVGAQEAEDLAPSDLKSDGVDHSPWAKPFGHVTDVNGRAGGGHMPECVTGTARGIGGTGSGSPPG